MTTQSLRRGATALLSLTLLIACDAQTPTDVIPDVAFSIEDGAHNDGINVAVPQGTSVKAAENGVVAYAGNELRGYGNLILVRHANNWVTAYAHNEKLLVKRGDTVRRGQIIRQFPVRSGFRWRAFKLLLQRDLFLLRGSQLLLQPLQLAGLLLLQYLELSFQQVFFLCILPTLLLQHSQLLD